MSLRRLILAAAVSGAALAAAASASAAVVMDFSSSDLSTAQTVDINGYVPKSSPLVPDPNLGATLSLTLVSITDNGFHWNFDYTISNTSKETSQVGAVGWNVTATSSGTVGAFRGVLGTTNESGDHYTNIGAGNMPMTLGDRNFCLNGSGGGGCAGGGGAGPTKGASASGSFSIDFLQSSTQKVHGHDVTTYYVAPTLLKLSDFAVHYQSLTERAGSSTVGRGSTPTVNAVPEPATWAMMLLGVFGLGATLRRRRGQGLAQAALG